MFWLAVKSDGIGFIMTCFCSFLQPPLDKLIIPFPILYLLLRSFPLYLLFCVPTDLSSVSSLTPLPLPPLSSLPVLLYPPYPLFIAFLHTNFVHPSSVYLLTPQYVFITPSLLLLLSYPFLTHSLPPIPGRPSLFTFLSLSVWASRNSFGGSVLSELDNTQLPAVSLTIHIQLTILLNILLILYMLCVEGIAEHFGNCAESCRELDDKIVTTLVSVNIKLHPGAG